MSSKRAMSDGAFAEEGDEESGTMIHILKIVRSLPAQLTNLPEALVNQPSFGHFEGKPK